MSSRRHIGFIAGAATLLAAFPLSTIYDRWTWLIQCLIAVFLVTGAATLARTLRAPLWAQALAMGAALLAGLTWLFPGDDTALLGIIPTDRTFAYFGQLLGQAGSAMAEQGIPVRDDDGLLFLTMLGVGAVGICIDVCAVGLRRPALAGLPMLAIYSVPVAVHLDSVPVIPFIAGSAGYLWLLATDNVDRVRRFGRRFTGDGRDIDVWEPSPLAAAGRRLAVVGVLVAIALPVAVPGMTTGLLDRFGTMGDGGGVGPGGGRAGQVNLWALLQGQLNQDQEFPMLQVTTNDPNPYYLRMAVSDLLAADGFRNRQPAGRTPVTDLPNPRDTQRGDVRYYDARAIVRITNLDMPLLPVYSHPTATRRLDNTWFYDNTMNVIFSTRSSTKNKTYEFDFVRSEFTPQALRRASPLPDGNPIQAQLTRVPEVPRIQALVNDLTRAATTPYDKVRALYDHFSAKNGFTYALEAKSDTSGEAIVDFLFDSKAGYCVQYAAALAWLVRAAGIPARVAFGFTQGQRDNDTYLLTNLNLHAWTEVYLDGFGWVPFDPTPSTSIRGSVPSVYAPDVNAPDPAASSSTGTSPGADSSLDPNDPTNPRNNVDLGEENIPGGGPITPADPRWPGYLVIAGVLVLLLVTAPALRRAMLRRRRRPIPAGVTPQVAGDGGEGTEGPLVVVVDGPEAARARRDAHAAWDELVDTLVDFRIPVDPAETPRTTAERIVRESELSDLAATGARLLGSAEERARYAREPLLTDQLGTAIRGVRRALAERVSRGTRLTAVLLPPSVLQRWRQAIINTSARTITTVGQARDTVLRTFNPRRLLPSRSSR